MDKILIYFGCINSVGHGLYLNETRTLPHYTIDTYVSIKGMNPNLFKMCDSTFPPSHNNSKEGLYNECIVPPFRIVAWWDRSVDSRPGSHSTFFGYGYESAEQMIDDAIIKFSKVMGRQKRPVKFEFIN